jgi:hypothetical protein
MRNGNSIGSWRGIKYCNFLVPYKNNKPNGNCELGFVCVDLSKFSVINCVFNIYVNSVPQKYRPSSRALLKKLTGSQLVKKFPTFCEN